MALSLCASSVDNLGELQCDKSRGVLKKLFIFNGSIAAADYADEETLFNKLVTNSKLSKSDSNKIFVINEAQDIADASEANTEGTLGLGFKAVLREGKPAYTIKIFAGADLLKRLRTFNNQTVRFMEWDANGTLWGTKSGTSYKGFQGKFFFVGNKLATGTNVEEGIVTITLSVLSTSEYFDNPYWASLAGYNIEDVKPLIDVSQAFVSNASNVHQISMKIPGSNLISDFNIYDDYMDAIDALTFTAFSGADDPTTALAITSIAKNASLKTLAVTYDNTDYGAATGNIKLVPPTPATLDAADITGIEILPVTYPKP
jgi:hypothetical protein